MNFAHRTSIRSKMEGFMYVEDVTDYFSGWAKEHGINDSKLFHALAEGFRRGDLIVVNGEITGNKVYMNPPKGHRLCKYSATKEDTNTMQFVNKMYFKNRKCFYMAIRYAMEKGRLGISNGYMVAVG